MADITTIFHHLQRRLFPALTAELGPLSALDQQFCEVISLTDLGRFTRRYEWCGNGAPPCPRTWLAHAFIAKSVYQFPTTSALIDALKSRPLLRQLCGWESAGEIPSEPAFCRAFAEFARDQLPQQIHKHMVKKHAGSKLVGHVSRDATAIEAPERPAAKPAPAIPAAPRKRGRPKRGEVRPSVPPKRLELQPARTLAENLADLPTCCDVGCKRNSKGHQESWIGYKLHLDTVDGDFPVSAVLTSASVHDSQVAIPLAQRTAQRVTSLYDLMDTGQQWFRAPAQPELCAHCWKASRCPHHFGYAVGQHETLLGLLPLASRMAQRLLRQVLPWIEPAQSFEKNQLGLGQMFFNSLRLTWQMSLWTDSAVLLRTMVWLDTPPEDALLAGLQPRQLELELPDKK